MKTIYQFLVILFSLYVFNSCTDVLDKKDLTALDEQTVWNDASYAEFFVNKLCIDNLPGWDTSDNSDNTPGGGNILYGQITSNDINDWPYTQIRNVNLFLQKIGTGNIDASTQSVLKGQALVLRAWLYFRMVRLYGGVPLILEPQELKDDLYVTRNKTSECITQIVKDLDDAINSDLPWSWSGDNAGKISKAAALALKARVLLFWASPQYNRPGTRDAQRWETAYSVNKQAKEQLENQGYGLYNSYSDLWFDEMNKEVIFVKRQYYPGETNAWAASTRPLEASTNYTGGNHPTAEFVDIYPMADGTSPSESPDYDPIHYWRNRDPRFEATIAYNSCYYPLIGRAVTRQWTYRGYAPEQNNGSRTGYYCRKAIDMTQTVFDCQNSPTDWIEIRYAEVLLNFAECAAETGHNDEAVEVLKQIRARAGILPGENRMYGIKTGLTGDDLINAIMFERRIELAFEGNKRYWDLRRRRLFAPELNGTRRHGRFANLVEPLTPVDMDQIRLSTPEPDWDTEYTKYFEDELVLIDTQYDINYPDSYYFYGIPNSHLEANSKLQQTEGWPDNGSGLFDPYQ
ncbi:MAG: RagB/SusD family nutrient uptake outer membrane protein [Tannerella sp.]|jgi:hypothetical protein|nr:RagB/SusD family nutrient uptake outer membrane protein [Tannerella sp.]